MAESRYSDALLQHGRNLNRLALDERSPSATAPSKFPRRALASTLFIETANTMALFAVTGPSLAALRQRRARPDPRPATSRIADMILNGRMARLARAAVVPYDSPP